MNSGNLTLVYLDENADTYSNNHTMSHIINLYVSKLLEIYNMKENQLNGRLSLQSF